jgi:hypothetical protein
VLGELRLVTAHASAPERALVRGHPLAAGITPFLQIPKIVVPAGFTDVVYEPQYALNEAKADYVSILAPGPPKSTLPHPMPIAMTFFSGQGEEPFPVKARNRR